MIFNVSATHQVTSIIFDLWNRIIVILVKYINITSTQFTEERKKEGRTERRRESKRKKEELSGVVLEELFTEILHTTYLKITDYHNLNFLMLSCSKYVVFLYIPSSFDKGIQLWLEFNRIWYTTSMIQCVNGIICRY